MGISHDIDSMLRKRLNFSDRKDIKFLFIGEGEKWQPTYDYGTFEGHSIDGCCHFSQKIFYHYYGTGGACSFGGTRYEGAVGAQ